MPNGNNVDETLGECIKTLQDVKRQWSSSIKELMYVLQKNYELDEIKEYNDTIMKNAGELISTQKSYIEARSENEKYYNSKIVQNASISELIEWATKNNKSRKLGKIIDRYRNDENSWLSKDIVVKLKSSEQENEKLEVGTEDILNLIAVKHKKKKVKQLKLIGGADDYEKFMKELIMAIVDSLVRFYLEDKHDDKQKQRISYAGIKGKKIYETFIKPNKKDSESNFLKENEKVKIKIKELKQKSLKDIMDVLKKYNTLSSNNSGNISNNLVNTTTGELMKCIGDINNNIKKVSEYLNELTTDLASAPPYDTAKVTPKRRAQ